MGMNGLIKVHRQTDQDCGLKNPMSSYRHLLDLLFLLTMVLMVEVPVKMNMCLSDHRKNVITSLSTLH